MNRTKHILNIIYYILYKIYKIHIIYTYLHTHTDGNRHFPKESLLCQDGCFHKTFAQTPAPPKQGVKGEKGNQERENKPQGAKRLGNKTWTSLSKLTFPHHLFMYFGVSAAPLLCPKQPWNEPRLRAPLMAVSTCAVKSHHQPWSRAPAMEGAKKKRVIGENA